MLAPGYGHATTTAAGYVAKLRGPLTSKRTQTKRQILEPVYP